MDADGRNIQTLTRGDEVSRGPAWSPDGKRIALTRHVHNRLPQIYVMDADGGNVVPLTRGEDFTVDPAWSPDGKPIAFSRTRADHRFHFRIYTIAANEKDIKELTTQYNEVVYAYPARSPDGKQIAFADMAAGALELPVMDVDGKNQRQLTQRGAEHVPGLVPRRQENLLLPP
jgi:TolB protein